VPVIVAGQVVHRPTLEQVRAHHARAMAELTDTDTDLTDGTPRLSGALN
jgi:nicotinate phosphoribosyltransferase